MDIRKAMEDLQVQESFDRVTTAGMKTLFLAPFPGELPDDGLLKYSKASDVQAILAGEDGEVLLFDEKDVLLLDMLNQFPEVFGVQLKTLGGLPQADYAPWFTSKVWNNDEVSYAGVVSELSLEYEAAAKKAEAEQTVHDRERQQVTRKSGSVKQHSRFSVAGLGDQEDDDDLVDDESQNGD